MKKRGKRKHLSRPLIIITKNAFSTRQPPPVNRRICTRAKIRRATTWWLSTAWGRSHTRLAIRGIRVPQTPSPFRGSSREMNNSLRVCSRPLILIIINPQTKIISIISTLTCRCLLMRVGCTRDTWGMTMALWFHTDKDSSLTRKMGGLLKVAGPMEKSVKEQSNVPMEAFTEVPCATTYQRVMEYSKIKTAHYTKENGTKATLSKERTRTLTQPRSTSESSRTITNTAMASYTKTPY